MATSKSGPNGPYSGKIGATNSYILYGKTVTRAFPHITKPRSIKQLALQQRMSVISPFLNLVKLYLQVGFQLAAFKNQNSANNSAKSYNLKYAIKGEYPNQEIDYPAVRLSEGNLALPLNPTAESATDGIRFRWGYNAYDPTGTRYDRSMLLVYFPEKNLFFQIIGGVQRAELTELLPVIPQLKGQYAETYISFITDDRKQISNSVYTGKLLF